MVMCVVISVHCIGVTDGGLMQMGSLWGDLGGKAAESPLCVIQINSSGCTAHMA